MWGSGARTAVLPYASMSRPADPQFDEALARMRWVRGLAGAMVQDADEADDLAQDAWQKALERPQQQSAAWRGWFAQVLRRRAVDQWRGAESREPLAAKLPPLDETLTPEEIVQRLETQQAIGEAVHKLEEPCRGTILLHYFEGWSLRQIAVAEGVQVRAVETRLRRGRDLIRRHLEKRGPVEHWAAGLLLLARPLSPPSLLLPGLAAAVLLIAAGWWAWSAWPDAAPPPAVAAAPAAAASPFADARGPTASTGADSAAAGLVRADVAAVPRTLQLAVVDAQTGQPLAGARVHGEFLDASGRVLAALEWLSTTPASAAMPIPAGAEQLRLATDPTATHAGAPAGGLYSWEARGAEPLIEIPSERLRGEILGQVLDSAGNPVAGAEVGLWLRQQESRGAPPDRLIPVAADGRFALPLAMAQEADLYLAPRAPGHSALRCYRLDRQRPANAYVEQLELLLAPGRELSVTVLDQEDAPVANAEVVVWPSQRADAVPVFPFGQYEGRLQHRLRTDRDGRAPALLIGAEPYSLAVRHPDHAHLSFEIEDLSAPLTLRLEPALQLRGLVLDPDGAPAAGVRVIAEGAERAECQTDGEGRFLLPSPSQAGEEILLILAPPAPHALQILGPLRPEDAQAGLECRLEAGRSLHVRLVGPDGRLCENLPGLRAELSGGPAARAANFDARTLQDWAEFLPPPPANPFQTAHPAELRAAGLPAGRYRVSFWGDDGLLAQAEVEAGAKPVDLALGAYPEARARLSGRLRHAATGAAVTQFQLECQRLGSADPEDLLPESFSMAYDREDGGFRCEGLPPGWWQVRFFGAEPGASWGLEALHLDPGQSVELAPRLDAVAEGRLRVHDAEGRPMPGLRVRLLDPLGQACVFGAPARFADRTDAQGGLELQRLPRSLALQVELSAADGRRWTLPAGTLDPAQSAWLVQVPR